MSRFFKSAAFPILIVVVLVFFAMKLLPGSSGNARPHSYQTLVSQEIPKGEVKSVEFKTKSSALEVELKNKEKYEIGYVDQAAPELFKKLEAAGIHFNVEANKSSVLLCLLLVTVLPILIFVFGSGSSCSTRSRAGARR